jgi:PAS domain S-box-containing protein
MNLGDGPTFQGLVSKMNLIAVILDSKAKLTYCNDYFLALTGWTRAEVLGRDWFQRFVPTGTDDLRSVFADLLNNLPSALHHENAIMCKSGEKVLIRWHNSVIRDSSDHIVGTASIGEDVTEHRLLERELLESSARERRHLAAELHDGLGQNLYAASLLARSLEVAAQKAALPIAADLVHLAAAIGSSMETCRRIAHGLSPLAEIRGGFIRALQDLTSMPAKGATEVALSIVESAPLLIDAVSLDHLFRLAQEAVTNALKHAEATLIQVTLDIQAALVTLTVVDDGIGLPSRPMVSDRLGLRLMRYRADMMHAKLTITRIKPHGTRITCECPQGNGGKGATRQGGDRRDRSPLHPRTNMTTSPGHPSYSGITGLTNASNPGRANKYP